MFHVHDVLEVDDAVPGTWRVTVDSPPLNLLGAAVFAALRDVLEQAEQNERVRVMTFESRNPEYFIAHLDDRILFEESERAGGVAFAEAWPGFVRRLAESPVVTVAVLRGRARGIGSEFALACDLRFASLEKAVLAQGEVGFGAIPGGGGIEWLTQLLGRSRALEVLLSADDVDARTAAAYGWVNAAVPDDDLDAAVGHFTRRVASFDRAAIREIKRLVNRSSRVPTVEELSESFDVIGWLAQTPQAQARMKDMVDRGFGRPTEVERDFPTLTAELGDKLGIHDLGAAT